jgi:hypothetical protein
VTDLVGIINARVSILFQAIQDGVLLRVNSHIGFASEPFLLAIVKSAGQLSLCGISHVPNVVRAEIVVKKQFISEPSILSSLRRFDVHPTGVFGTHVGQDVPYFALVILEGSSGVGIPGSHFKIYGVVVVQGVRGMMFHLNFLSDHVIQCGPFRPILRCQIFSDAFHSPRPIFVIYLWLNGSFIEAVFIPMLLAVATYHSKHDRGCSGYSMYPFRVF